MKWLFFIFFTHSFLAWGKQTSPSIIYLTWWNDPTSTMRIHWHTTSDELSCVTYRKKHETQWLTQKGSAIKLPRGSLRVYTVELVDLEQDTEYEFRIEEDVFCFRTLPVELKRPVRFAVGGDAYFYLTTFKKMNAQIAVYDPDFVVVGGDIAYTYGVSGLRFMASPMKRWHTFFKECKEHLVTREGRLIPLVPVVGNHDLLSNNGAAGDSLFYHLFAFPQVGVAFRTLDVGEYLSLFLLDTGHSCPIEGRQTQWLKQAIAQRENRPYKIAAYHVAGYPSHYPYAQATPAAIRTEWSPLFERYHLSVAFEHHNHTYKRTYPLKEGRVDPNGIVYMGDGSWGVGARKVFNRWYLARAEAANAVCIVTLTEQDAKVDVIGLKGQILDSLELYPTHPYSYSVEKQLLPAN